MALSHSLLLVNLFIIFIKASSSQLTVVLSTDDAVSIGDDVTVHCRVQHYEAGGALMWWKRQGEEQIQVGVNKQLDVNLDRYSLDVDQAGDTMLFYLNIRGVQPEDSGDFGCSLTNDPDKQVFRNLVVSDPIDSLHFYSLSSAGQDAEVLREFHDGEELFFHDGEDYFFRCVAHGSNPSADMTISIGYQDGLHYIHEDYFEEITVLTSDPEAGEIALRRSIYDTTMSSKKPVTVGWKANSQEFKCSASVPNMEAPLSVHIKPVLKIPPVIECEQSMKIPIWSSDVTISCTIFADPLCQAIRWYWGDEDKGYSLSPGETLGIYTFQLEDGVKPDMKIAKLTISRAEVIAFKRYNLMAKNLKGVAVHAFELERDLEAEALKYQSGASRFHLSYTILAISTVTATLHIFLPKIV